MKAFFTGSSGFLGSNLVETLKNRHPNLFIHHFNGQIENYDSIERDFKTDSWDIVIHFAGLSHVGDCEKNPQLAFEVNTLGTVNLCQVMTKYKFKGHVYFASTAQVFAASNNELGVVVYDENSSIHPQNIYGATKYYAESALESYAKVNEGRVTILRLFNHTHKTQPRKFLLPSVYHQIMEAKDGDSIKVGDLNLDRDFSLLREFLNFFSGLLERKETPKFEVLCLSSGIARNLLNLVKILIQKSGKKISIEVNPELVRKGDAKVIVGKFKTSYLNGLSDEQFIESFIKE